MFYESGSKIELGNLIQRAIPPPASRGVPAHDGTGGAVVAGYTVGDAAAGGGEGMVHQFDDRAA